MIRSPTSAADEGQVTGMDIEYRSDLDGLRALAVSLVVLFHLGVPWLAGGYVGVDIFFVISGFLITSIVARQIDEGRYSLLTFYERRARRILPALIAVLAVVLVLSAFVLLPSHLRPVPRIIWATLLFGSNVLFAQEAGYFASDVHTLPLLHTWSLAVEEQFYLAFPLLLAALHAFGSNRRAAVVWTLALASLVLGIALLADHPNFTFYMLPTRAWELLTGSLLAIGAVPRISRPSVRLAAAAAGLGLILYAAFGFTEDTPFPGLNALYPVLGTALVIHAAPGTPVGRALGWRPAVFVGLLSYSLYLWHWPIIVFARYVLDRPLQGAAQVGALCAMVVAAFLSWRFVERPFRSPRTIRRGRLLGHVAVASSVLFVGSAALRLLDGWPGRFAPEVVAFEAAAGGSSPLREACHGAVGRIVGQVEPCALGTPNTVPTYAVWGDSHGVELSYALAEHAAHNGSSLAQLTASKCPPFLLVDLPELPGCAEHNRAVLGWLGNQPQVRTVFIVGFWANRTYAELDDLDDGLLNAVRSLREDGRRVILIDAVPANDFDVPHRLANLSRTKPLSPVAGICPKAVDHATAYLELAGQMLVEAGVEIVRPSETLCTDKTCAIVSGNRPLYFDSHHLSVDGARMVAAAAAAVFGCRPDETQSHL